MRNMRGGKAPKSLKTVKRSVWIHFVISRSCVRVTPPAPKSIENFGFRCFFVAKTLKMVWVKMWVNCLTHIVTYIDWQSAALPPTASSCPMGTRKCTERVKEYRRGSFCFSQYICEGLFCALFVPYGRKNMPRRTKSRSGSTPDRLFILSLILMP